MKTISSIFWMVCSLNFVSAQTDSMTTKKQFEFGVRSGFYSTAYLNGLNYFGYLTMSHGIHEFSIGPSIGSGPAIYHPFYLEGDNKSYQWDGIDLSYRIFPNGHGKIFDFYFQLDYFQKWGKADCFVDHYNYPNPSELAHDTANISSVASQMFLEYGFDVRFLKYFYFGGAMGFGGRCDFRNYEYELYSQFNSSETQIGFDVVARFNLGVRF